MSEFAPRLRMVPSDLELSELQLEFLSTASRETILSTRKDREAREALMVAAVQYADVPEYEGLFLVHNQETLEYVQEEYARLFVVLDVKFDPASNTWTFPAGGTLKVIIHDPFVRSYAGNYNFVGMLSIDKFDEYDYMRGHNSLTYSSMHSIPPRFRATYNPRHWQEEEKISAITLER